MSLYLVSGNFSQRLLGFVRHSAKSLSLTALAALAGASCAIATPQEGESEELAEIKVKNSLDVPIASAFISTDDPALMAVLNKSGQDFHVTREGQAVSSQALDADGDGTIDQLILVQDLPAGGEVGFEIEPGAAPEGVNVKRTQAEISVKEGGGWTLVKQKDGSMKHVWVGGEFKNVVELDIPPEHTDHSDDIRYEGAGWESDLVGYRLYSDWRHAIDVFGKKTHDMELQHVGMEDFERYHHPADWGQDILKVGTSLGLGSIGWWDGSEAQRVAETDGIRVTIPVNGDLCSRVAVDHKNWKVGDVVTNLHSELTIAAGSRLTRYDIAAEIPTSNICTGMVKMPNTVMIDPPVGEGWSWMATWGKQSLFPDELGLAVFFRSEDVIELAEDGHSHVVVLRPADGKVSYYLAACWVQELGGVKNEADFRKFLNDSVQLLNNPPSVEIEMED